METLIPEKRTPEELIEFKKQKLAAMTVEERRERFLQACERADKRLQDEFVRKHQELLKRKQAEQEEPAAEVQL